MLPETGYCKNPITFRNPTWPFFKYNLITNPDLSEAVLLALPLTYHCELLASTCWARRTHTSQRMDA